MIRSSGLFVSLALSLALVAVGCGSKTPVSEVTVTSVGVTPAAPSIAAGTQQPFQATAVRSDGTSLDVTAQAQWSSSDESVASVDAAGVVTSHQPGTATIRATFGGTTGETALTVTDAIITELQVTSPNGTLARGTMAQLTATGVFSDGSTQDVTASVSWSSSAPERVSLSTEVAGMATAEDLGSAVMTATDAATGVSATLTLYVTNATLKRVEITPNDASIALGTEQQFEAMGTFSDGSKQNLTSQVTWAVSDAAVASISNLGLARATGAGNVVVSAVIGTSSAAANLTVTSATLESIAVSASSPNLARGTTGNVTATGTYSDGTTQDLTSQVTWTSSDPAVADVSNAMGSEGLVTALAPGKVVMSAQDSASGVSGSLTISITQAELVSIAVTPVTASIPAGQLQSFVATGTFSDGSTQDLTSAVLWSASDSAVLSVSNATGTWGVVHGESVGSATLTATAAGSAISGTASVDVVQPVLVSLAITPGAAAISRGTTQQFNATGTFSDGSTQDLTASVTWTSSDPNVATLSTTAGSEGLATGANLGTTTITAASAGGVTASAPLTVTNANLVSLAVSPNAPGNALGTQRQFTVTGTYSDNSTLDLTSAVTWTSSNAAVATVSNGAGTHGLASTLSLGSSTITATDPVSGLTGSTTLTVTNAVLTSLDISPLTASIVVNTAQQYAAIGTFSDGSTQDVTTTATWTSSDTTIATVSNTAGAQGEAQGVATGSATITAALNGITSNAATLTVTARALVGITVAPGGVTVLTGTPQQFTATGNYNDGTTDDLTASVTWLSSDPSVLIVSNTAGSQGVGMAISTGTTTVFATLNNVSGSTQVTTFAPPAVCAAETDPDSGAPYVVCAADGSTAWLSSTGYGGQYHYQYICQLQGYTGANLYGGTCGSTCGHCEQSTTCSNPGTRTFDGSGLNCGSDAHGPILCQTVTWQCYR